MPLEPVGSEGHLPVAPDAGPFSRRRTRLVRSVVYYCGRAALGAVVLLLAPSSQLNRSVLSRTK